MKSHAEFSIGGSERSTHTALRDFIAEMPLGHPVVARSLQRFGIRDAVDNALSHLVYEVEIRRFVRGVYVRPEVLE